MGLGIYREQEKYGSLYVEDNRESISDGNQP